MKKFILIVISLILTSAQMQAQTNAVYGKVHAFKDLPLNNIKVEAKKAKTSTTTDAKGYFKINCEKRDKLEFSGEGFQKEKLKPESRKRIDVKLIFEGGDKNVEKAVEAGHVSKEDLLQSIKAFHEYNFNFYEYPDVFTLIDKIYEDNFDIKVNNKSVYVRPDNKSSFPGTPAVFIVNGKLALEIQDILPRNIATLKVIPDGSARYGARAANGAVLITTVE